MRDTRVRLLVIDDDPIFVRSDTQLLSFLAGSGEGDEEILDRNFRLQWMYDLGQAKEYAARVRVALRDNPASLLHEAGYPHLFMFDYSMQNALLKRRMIRTTGSDARYAAELSPLSGSWGTRFELLGNGPEVRDQFEWHPLPGDNQHGGCIAGVDITTLLDPYLHVGIPQTIHRNPESTAGLEWHLSPNLGPLFRDKTGVLPHWYAFFHKALEELRRKIQVASGVGLLVPRISDLLTLCEANELTLTERTLRISSALGEEEIRVESLFLDILYHHDEVEGRMVPADPVGAVAAVRTWARSVLEGLTGPWSRDEVRAGLETAARFIAAHADPLHHSRRCLSRLLHHAGPDEIDEVVEENEVLLGELGISAGEAKAKLKAGKGKELTLPTQVAERCGVLANLKTEAATEESGRYAGLAMIVWGEMVWKTCIANDFDRWVVTLEDVLDGRTILDRAIRERLQKLSGLVVRDRAIQAFLDDPSDPAARQGLAEAFNQGASIFASLQALTDFMNRNDIWRRRSNRKGDAELLRSSNDRGAKTAFIRYVFDPAPRRLLMWEEAESDVDRQPARLGISIAAIIGGEPGALRPGEGRLIQLFASEFGFEKSQWPSWMLEACKA